MPPSEVTLDAGTRRRHSGGADGGGGCSQDLRMMIYKEGKKGRKCQDWNERDFQSVKANEESHILMVFRQLNNGGQSGPINEMGTNEQPTT